MCVDDVRDQPVAPLFAQVPKLPGGHGAAEQRRGPPRRLIESLLQELGLEQIAGTDPGARGLLSVHGPDAATGRAVRLRPARDLNGLVDFDVKWEDKMRPIGDAQAGGRNACRLQHIQLLEQGGRIDDHTRADDAVDLRVADSGGDLVQTQRPSFTDDGVPGVVAAVVTNDQVGSGRQGVDHLALALVAPVAAHDCGYRHPLLLLVIASRDAAKQSPRTPEIASALRASQ